MFRLLETLVIAVIIKSIVVFGVGLVWSESPAIIANFTGFDVVAWFEALYSGSWALSHLVVFLMPFVLMLVLIGYLEMIYQLEKRGVSRRSRKQDKIDVFSEAILDKM